jgi:hypothetical protein
MSISSLSLELPLRSRIAQPRRPAPEAAGHVAGHRLPAPPGSVKPRTPSTSRCSPAQAAAAHVAGRPFPAPPGSRAPPAPPGARRHVNSQRRSPAAGSHQQQRTHVAGRRFPAAAVHVAGRRFPAPPCRHARHAHLQAAAQLCTSRRSPNSSYGPPDKVESLHDNRAFDQY